MQRNDYFPVRMLSASAACSWHVGNFCGFCLPVFRVCVHDAEKCGGWRYEKRCKRIDQPSHLSQRTCTDTHPAKKPTEMALTLPVVTGSPKKTIPLKANGNLLSAPTMLYVVLLVVRTHHAVV